MMEGDWAPQQINMRSSSRSNGDGNSNGRIDRRQSLKKASSAASNDRKCDMFESFRNLEDAMEMAKMESLSTANNANAHSTLAQSFRNLDLALAQAKQDSLNDANHKLDRRGGGGFIESFRNLDDATALAIQNSLSDKGRGLFESFRNLDGALSQATMDSLDGALSSAEADKGLFESFRNLDDAMAMAMKESLGDSNAAAFSMSSGRCGGLGDSAIGSGDYQYLERLDEDYGGEQEQSLGDTTHSGYSGRSSEGSGSGGFQSPGGGKGTSSADQVDEKLRSSCNSHNSQSRVEHVAEPAPHLSRLARRHADRRIVEHRLIASLNLGDLDDGEGGRRGSEDDLGGSADKILNSTRRSSTSRVSGILGRSKKEKSSKEKNSSSSKSSRRKSSSSRNSSMRSSKSSRSGSSTDVIAETEDEEKVVADAEEAIMASLHYSRGRRVSTCIEEQMSMDTLKDHQRKKKHLFGAKKK